MREKSPMRNMGWWRPTAARSPGRSCLGKTARALDRTPARSRRVRISVEGRRLKPLAASGFDGDGWSSVSFAPIGRSRERFTSGRDRPHNNRPLCGRACRGNRARPRRRPTTLRCGRLGPGSCGVSAPQPRVISPLLSPVDWQVRRDPYVGAQPTGCTASVHVAAPYYGLHENTAPRMGRIVRSPGAYDSFNKETRNWIPDELCGRA